ncbi:MAG: sulfotransferase [Bacteroidetes bacterium]|nr:sulfotransferase [Bacteroidota bacterium]
MLENLNNENTVVVIGRGHSGTRLMSDTLKESGYDVGSPLNVAGDLIPAESIYEACRIFGKFVDYKGKHEWDFTRAVEAKIPDGFKDQLTVYLKSVLESKSELKGWKIPQSTLIYPWLVRLLPNIKYVFWIREPKDTILKMHGIDRLEKWNIPCKKYLFHSFNYRMRAVSWKYHYDIVNETPRPKNFLMIRFEDFVLNQDACLQKLEKFLGRPVAKVHVIKSKVGMWKKNRWVKNYSFLKKPMLNLNYD